MKFSEFIKVFTDERGYARKLKLKDDRPGIYGTVNVIKGETVEEFCCNTNAFEKKVLETYGDLEILYVKNIIIPRITRIIVNLVLKGE